jgi:antitoxin component of MazEF toxin-antitoxin module
LPRSKIKTAVFIIVFIIAWLPLLLPIFTSNTSSSVPLLVDFSIYNPAYNGCQQLKVDLNSEGYVVQPLLSSLSVLSRYPNSTCLIIGPSVIFYDPIEVSELANFVREGGGLLIADNFGTADTLLVQLFPMLGIPTPTFTKHILYEATDANSTTWTPAPLITNFNSNYSFTQGVNQILLNYPCTITNVQPGNVVAISPNNSWLDMNDNGIIDVPPDVLGPQTVAAAYDLNQMGLGSGRIVLVSCPAIFNDDMINRANNSIFCTNIVDWLAQGRGGASYPIIVDEAQLALPATSYERIFGYFMGYIDSASSNWLLAPIYPVLLAFAIWRWLPRKKKPEPLSPTEVFMRRGKTFFSEKMMWYTQYQLYGNAVKLLYRSLKRELVRQLGLKEGFSVDAAVKAAIAKNPSIKEKEVRKLLELCEEISTQRTEMFMNKNEFLDLFFQMQRLLESVRNV